MKTYGSLDALHPSGSNPVGHRADRYREFGLRNVISGLLLDYVGLVCEPLQHRCSTVVPEQGYFSPNTGSLTDVSC
jgi:hypothetical protein